MSIDFLLLFFTFFWIWWLTVGILAIRSHDSRKEWVSLIMMVFASISMWGISYLQKAISYEETPKPYIVSIGEGSIAYIEDLVSSKKVNLNKHLDRNFKDGEQVLLRRTKDYVWYGPLFKSQELSFKESK